MIKTNLEYLRKYLNGVSGVKISIAITTIVFLVLYYPYVLGDKIYMSIGDPMNSYVPHYLYMQDAMKNMNLDIWDFSLGSGNSIFTVSVCSFEIFNILLFLISREHIYLFLILTLYLKLIGITFFMYKYLELINVKDKYTKIFFTIAWTFNGFMLGWGEHYFFATAVVYFTMMVYGLELVLQSNKKIIFATAVFLTGVYSLYIMVPMVIFVVIYTICWSILNNESDYIRAIMKNCISVGIVAGIAMLCAAPSVLSQIAILINSPRTDENFKVAFFNFDMITQMIGRILSLNLTGNRINYIGYFNYFEMAQLTSSIFVLICFISSIMSIKSNDSKKENIMKILLLVCVILMLTTNVIAGVTTFYTKFETRMFYPVIFAMIIVAVKHFDSGKYEKNNFVFFILYMCAAISMQKVFYYIASVNEPLYASHYIFYSFFLVFLFIGLYSFNKSKKMLVVLLLFEVISNNILTTWYINPNYSSSEVIGNITANTQLIDEIEKNDSSNFYRIVDINEYNGVSRNQSVMYRYKGVNTYSSLMHPQYVNFGTELGLKNDKSNLYINAASSEYAKQNLYDYFGVKYLLDTINKQYSVNDTAYSFGTLYTDIIKESDISDETTEMKSYSLLNYAILPDDSLYESNTNVQDDFRNITTVENSLINTEQIDNLEGSENNYLSYTVMGIDPKLIYQVDPTTNLNIDISLATDNAGVLEVFYGNDENAFSETNRISVQYEPGNIVLPVNIRSNFEISKVRIDCGADGEKITIDTKFTSSGNTKSEKEMYADKTFVNITSFENTNITGDIATEKDGVLVFTMPLDNGWSVFANGVELETFKVDYGMTGVYLEKGTYNLELKYKSVYFNIGCIIALISISGVVIYLILDKRKKLNNKAA